MNRLALISAALLAAGVLNAAKLTPQAAAAFDAYTSLTEAKIHAEQTSGHFLGIADSAAAKQELRSGQTLIQAGATRDNGKRIDAPGAMIQDWIGAIFIPGATIDQAKSVMQDYDNYKDYYAPDVIASRLISRKGDDFEVFLRLFKKQMLTVVFNATYNVHYSMPDPRHMLIVSRSTRIAQVKDAKKPDGPEDPVGDDLGLLWRLNSYWRFEEADGGVYVECRAISLSRDVPGFLAWMVRGFIDKFPKESMQNTLRGTKDAILKKVHSH